MAKFTREEYETILCYDFAEKTWTAYTNIPSAIAKFKEQGWKIIRENYYEDGTVESCRFEAPKSAVTIRKAVRQKRVLSEQHKEKLLSAKKRKVNE